MHQSGYRVPRGRQQTPVNGVDVVAVGDLKKKILRLREAEGQPLKAEEPEADFLPQGNAPVASPSAPVPPKPMGGAKVSVRPPTVSINPGKVLQQQAKPEAAATENKPEVAAEEDVPFTQEQLKVALKMYVDSLGPAKKHNLLMIWTSSPQQIEGSTIRVTVTNKTLASLLEQERPDMLEMIRARLRNRQVSLEVQVELPPEAPVTKMLTNNERFDLLAQKNPILLEMKQKFDLDTETPH